MPVPVVVKVNARRVALDEINRRARWTLTHSETEFERQLGLDVLALLRELRRLEQLLPRSLPFESESEV